MTPEAVDHLMDLLAEENEEAIRFTGLDEAVIGIANQHAGLKPVLCYSERRILEVLASKQFKDTEDPDESAQEWYGFNIQCLAVGAGTPVIISDEEYEHASFQPEPHPIDGEGSATD
jgi:hypothetical protein